MLLQTGPLALPPKAFTGGNTNIPGGIANELIFSELCGRYAHLVKLGKVFYVSAIITAPVIFSTAAQLGPIIWNRPNSNLDAHILGLSVGSPTVATTVAGSIGYASNSQTTLPTSQTALVPQNAYAGGANSQIASVGTGGTVSILPAPGFLPLVAVNTGAITTQVVANPWIDLGGGLIVGPGSVGYVCGSATLTAGVFTIGLLWAELPA